MFTQNPAVVWTKPFGLPVDPEVYIIYRGDSESIHTGSHCNKNLSFTEKPC